MDGKKVAVLFMTAMVALAGAPMAAIIGTFQNSPALGADGCAVDYSIYSPAVVDGYAGQRIEIPVTIESRSACSVTVDVIVSVPTGWAFNKVPPESLEAGQSRTVQAGITPADDARTGTVTFGAVASGRGVASSTMVRIAENQRAGEKTAGQAGQMENEAAGQGSEASGPSPDALIAVVIVVAIVAFVYAEKLVKRRKLYQSF